MCWLFEEYTVMDAKNIPRWVSVSPTQHDFAQEAQILVENWMGFLDEVVLADALPKQILKNNGRP